MKLILYIFVTLKTFYMYCKCSDCCTCSRYKKEKTNINNKEDNKEDSKKERKYENEDIKIDKKWLEDYKVCYEKCFFEYEKNNCSVKSTLSIFCKIFNKKKIIDNWLKSDNIVLKTLGEILDRYSKNDKSKKDYDIFFHCLLNYFVDYYNDNIDEQKKKTEVDKDFKDTIKIFLDFFGNYKFKEIQKDNRLITFNDLFNNVDRLEKRTYTDFFGRFNLNGLIFIINKFYPLSYQTHGYNYFQVENDIYTDSCYDFNRLYYLALHVKYFNIGHQCIVFKEDNKFYFENCDKVFELNEKLVEACWKNCNYQPIIDIYIREGGINYKYKSADDFLYQYKNKNIDDVIYECTKNNISYDYNKYKDNEDDPFVYEIKFHANYYNLPEDIIRKIYKELNINI